VLAGGEGSRLRPLTAEDAKPALPLGGGYRIIDFVLSNLLNSGITEVYVLAQYKPRSLVAHLDGSWRGRFARAGGVLRTVLPPVGGHACYRGTADAVRCNLGLLKAHQPDLVAVFAADHVYRMDVRQMVDFHRATAATVSVAALRVPVEQACAFGVIAADERQRIVGFQEKPADPQPLPDDPMHAYVSMGNYLFEPATLVRLLDDCAGRGGHDFGYHIMPMLAGHEQAFAYDFARQRLPGLQSWEDPAYWRDVGTPQALLSASRDIAGPSPCIDVNCAGWPMHRERRTSARLALPVRLRTARPVGAGAELASQEAA
jgi:glucose-1-phosphate adenylyltransferase